MLIHKVRASNLMMSLCVHSLVNSSKLYSHLASYLHINSFGLMEPLDIFTVYLCDWLFVFISDEHEPPLPEDVAEKFRELIEGGGSPDAEIEQQGSYI